MNNPLEQMREALEAAAQDCPNCANYGSWLDGQEWMQCEFCYTVPNSRFNIDRALTALSAHEQDLTELVKLSEHALAALRAHGYNIAADHLAEVVAKVKGETK